MAAPILLLSSNAQHYTVRTLRRNSLNCGESQ